MNVRRIFEPSSIFFIIIFFFLWLPSLYIYSTKLYINLWITTSFKLYDQAAFLFLILSSISILFYALGVLFWKIFIDNNTRSSLGFKKPKLLISNKFQGPSSLLNKRRSINSLLIKRLSYISIICVIVYILGGGLDKIYLLGSNLSKMEFRFAETFSDENYALIAVLQIVRRVFFPLVIVVYSAFIILNKNSDKLYYYLLVLFFLIASVITLDRAPLITFFLVFGYLWFLRAKINFAFLYKFPLLITVAMFFAGVMTFIQHNITSFSFFDVLGASLEFIWRRVWAAPTIVGIELSTHLFPLNSEKLNLEYSRIMALFGFERIGSQTDASIYVGPVSYVGDIWRNMGFTGIITISFLLGILLSYFDYVSRKIQLPYAVGMGVLTITFAFYLTHGVFFSMGVFFQMIFMVFFGVYSLLNYRALYR